MPTRRLRSALEWTAGLAAAAYLAWIGPHVLLGIVVVTLLILGAATAHRWWSWNHTVLVGLLLIGAFAITLLGKVH